jgi:acetate---CoA ligase (ADP-forming)
MFFNPRGVAVVGASQAPMKVGHMVLRNLITGNFQGGIYAVNRKETEILGIPSYPSLTDIPGEVDLAVIVVPAKFVLGVVEDAAQKGVKGIIIISAGFRETGESGIEMEQAILKKAKEHGIRIIGPNCLGIVNTENSLNASFVGAMPSVGNVGFISQSGALCSAVLDWAYSESIGFSKFISVGNKSDVAEPDLIRALGQDPQTEVILLYAEDITSGRDFLEVVEEVSKEKPIIVLKSGRTASGQKAISSHTGSLAGDDTAYDKAITEAGAIRVNTIKQMFELAKAFTNKRKLQGKNIAIVTNAGGPGVMTTDAIEIHGLHLAELSEETTKRLESYLPSAASVKNPVDVLGDALSDRYGFAVQNVLADDGVDAVVVILTPQAMTDIEGTARVVAQKASVSSKPVFCVWMGENKARKALYIFEESKLPHYGYPEDAIYVFSQMCRYTKRQRRADRQWTGNFGIQNPEGRELIESVRREGRTVLYESEARKLVSLYGITVSKSTKIQSKEEINAAIEGFRYPLVAKVVSEDILHKSDIGGVVLGINSIEEAYQAFDQIHTSVATKAPNARVDGILFDEMYTGDKKEIILGVKRTEFGPMVMVGLGGVFVEVFKDVAFSLAPLSEETSTQLVNDVHSLSVLDGVRGESPFDKKSLVDALVKLSYLALLNPEVQEIDINPLFVLPDGAGIMAVDVKVIVE